MTRSLDRRKQYTRMVLKDSLMHLLREKQMSSITVKEICHLADVNRSTFYAHYYNQYDLLENIEDETIEDMKGYLNQFQYGKEEDGLHVLENLFAYFEAKREICMTLLDKNTETSFQNKATMVAHDFFMKHLTTESHLDNQHSTYLSAFIINGSIHVVKSWLAHGMDKPPKEMAEILSHLIHKGLMGM